jgi:hypothetical protein
MGYLQAHQAKFEEALVLSGQKAVFIGCTLASITVNKDASFKGKQIIELRQGTKVTGSITFESGKGEVHLYPGATVKEVLGGALVHHK